MEENFSLGTFILLNLILGIIRHGSQGDDEREVCLGYEMILSVNNGLLSQDLSNPSKCLPYLISKTI